MNKAELIAKIAEESKLTKKAAETALDALLKLEKEQLEKVETHKLKLKLKYQLLKLQYSKLEKL